MARAKVTELWPPAAVFSIPSPNSVARKSLVFVFSHARSMNTCLKSDVDFICAKSRMAVASGHAQRESAGRVAW